MDLVKEGQKDFWVGNIFMKKKIIFSLWVFLLPIFSHFSSLAEVPPMEVFFPLTPGTTWIYRDSDHQYEKRQIIGLKNLEVPGFGAETKTLTFIEMKVQRGDREKILSPKHFKKGGKAEIQEEVLYYLKTSRGILRSSALGETAKDFWPSAFLLIPEDINKTKNWISMVHGSRLSFQLEDQEDVRVPSGNYESCLHIQYQHGLELDGKGKIFYCPGVGETKVSEEDFQRELVQFSPAISEASAVALLSEEETQHIWDFLPQQETVSPDSPFLNLTDLKHQKPKKSLPIFWLGLFALISTVALGIWYLLRRIRMDEIPAGDERVHDILQQTISSRKEGQLERTLEQLQELAERYPNYADIHFQLGCVFQDLKKSDEAIKRFKKAVRINSKYLEAHRHLATLFREKGDLEEALSCFRVILIQRPDFADIHNEAGEIHRELGNKGKARKHFEQALAINPHFSTARQNLMQI